jgi:threonine aldolase
MIDLRSDTVTKPTIEMKSFMMDAKLGDDVFEDDPSVRHLEDMAASLFGKEAGLFCPSGTMTNQIALMTHLKPGDEVICSRESHIYNYEGGGIARNAGASVRLIERKTGLLTVSDIADNINPDDVHQPVTKLVALENTCNRGGGNCYDINEIKAIKEFCDKIGLPVHLDGARLFNAIVKKDHSAEDYGACFDSISICLSKGLGAPLGSLLLGDAHFIKIARRNRKVLGGGMRQVGIVASAGTYALNHHVDRLKDDHEHAQIIANALANCSWINQVLDVETNIIVASLKDDFEPLKFLHKLEDDGVLAIPFGKGKIRMVTHLDVSSENVEKVVESLKF